MGWANYLKGEAKKQRRSLFSYLSIGLPPLFSLVVMGYFKGRQTMFTDSQVFFWFFEIIALGTPLISALFAGMLIQQEEQAGQFKNILGHSQAKWRPLMSKVVFMIGCYSLSLLLASSVYYLLILKGTTYDLPLLMYCLTIVLFILCAIFQYFLASFVAFRFGSGAASLLGLAGVIVTALSMTALGDQIWLVLPWAWSDRILISLYGIINETTNQVSHYQSKLFILGMLVMFFMTASFMTVFYRWANKWEGETSS